MDFFRSLLLRRVIVAIFLLMGFLSQSREIFACDLQGGKFQLLCCCGQPMERAGGCDMGGGCGSPADYPTKACCKVETVELASLTSPFSGLFQWLTALLDGPQPLPDFFPIWVTDTALIRPFLSRSDASFLLSAWFPGTHTYLLTHRLRN